MFQRISCRFGDNIIPTLCPAEGHLKRGVFEQAEILAYAWIPILQGSTTRAGKTSVVEWMQARPTGNDDGLETQTLFTTNSITATFKACKLGKACGPDRLGNDWYIHYSLELIPLMLKLFRLGTTPTSAQSPFWKTKFSALRRRATVVTRSNTDPYHY